MDNNTKKGLPLEIYRHLFGWAAAGFLMLFAGITTIRSSMTFGLIALIAAAGCIGYAGYLLFCFQSSRLLTLTGTCKSVSVSKQKNKLGHLLHRRKLTVPESIVVTLDNGLTVQIKVRQDLRIAPKEGMRLCVYLLHSAPVYRDADTLILNNYLAITEILKD